MKKPKYILAYSALTLIIFIISFSSCKKDKDMKAVIKVKYLSDTTKNAVNALVKVYIDKAKLANMVSKTYDTIYGYTDGAGEFTATFKYEAIYDIKAQKDNLKGQSIIRLKVDNTVGTTVLIH